MSKSGLKTIHERLAIFARIFWINNQLLANRFPNAQTIAAHFEVNEKTARRTLEFMRDQLQLPIEYSQKRRGFYFSEPSYPLPVINITEGELIALMLAEKLARAYRGTAIERLIEQAFGKVLTALSDVLSIDLNALSEAYSFEASPTSDIDTETVRLIGQAITGRRTLEMTYFTAGRGELSDRRINPLHLRSYLGDWYVIAFDHRRGGIRDFHVGRIRRLRLTEETFEPPDGFDKDEYLKTGFAMIRGGEPIDVEMIFDEYQSRWMRERGKYHATEAREELADGRLCLRMRVSALDGVKRFVMQYGARVEVTKPAELRELICAELEAMRRMYGDG